MTEKPSHRPVGGQSRKRRTIRSIAPARAFVVTGALVWGCNVYDSDLISSNGQLTSSGGMASGGSISGASSAAGNTSLEGGAGVGGDAAAHAAGGADVGSSEAGAANEGGESSSVGGAAGASGGAGAAGEVNGGTSGSGGSGGTAPIVTCGDHPIPLKSTWLASASSSSLGNGTEADYLFNPPKHMIDSNNDERWASGKNQGGDEWIQIDFGVVVALKNVTMSVDYNNNLDYPRGYAVRVSNQPLDFQAPIRSSGAGMPGSTVINFATPVVGRYLTVRQTGVNDPAVLAWWAISELLVGCVD